MLRTTDSDAVWKALADERRRAILDELVKGAMTTGEVVALFPELCRTAVMRHLEILVAAGLVLPRREGRTRWNHLNPMPIQQIFDRWVEPHLRKKTRALARLKEVVAGGDASATKTSRRRP